MDKEYYKEILDNHGLVGWTPVAVFQDQDLVPNVEAGEFPTVKKASIFPIDEIDLKVPNVEGAGITSLRLKAPETEGADITKMKLPNHDFTFEIPNGNTPEWEEALVALNEATQTGIFTLYNGVTIIATPTDLRGSQITKPE